MRYAGLYYYTGTTARGSLGGAVTDHADALPGAAGGPPSLAGQVLDRSILLLGRID